MVNAKQSSKYGKTCMLLIGLLACMASTCVAQKAELTAGVAKVDITPADLTGLVGMSHWQGVHDHLYARAIVLTSGGTTAAIVALDLVEMGNTTALRQRIVRELSIPADHIIIDASHDHSAPRGGPPTPGTSSAEGRPYSPPAYVQQVDDAIVSALKQAMAAMRPARIGFGTGKVDVNVARYGYTPERGWGEHPNEDGFADKTLAVLEVTDPAGKPFAILFNYAVHSNSMAGDPMVHGDIAGNAEKFVEHQYGGKVVALWSMGAAADAYPKFNGDMGALDDASSYYQAIELQGSMIGGEVMKVIGRIKQTEGTAEIVASERMVPCEMNTAQPSQRGPGFGASPGSILSGEPAGQANGGGQFHPPVPSKQLLPKPKPGDKLDIDLSLIRINQIALTGVSGEVGSGIYQHLRRESPFTDTVMITLSNDRDGYIPDDANWDHAGNNAAFVRGCAEKAIVENLVAMMKGTQ